MLLMSPSLGGSSTQGERMRGLSAHPLTQRVEAKHQDQQAKNTRATQPSPLLAYWAEVPCQRGKLRRAKTTTPTQCPTQRTVVSHQGEQVTNPTYNSRNWHRALPRELT